MDAGLAQDSMQTSRSIETLRDWKYYRIGHIAEMDIRTQDLWNWRISQISDTSGSLLNSSLIFTLPPFESTMAKPNSSKNQRIFSISPPTNSNTPVSQSVKCHSPSASKFRTADILESNGCQSSWSKLSVFAFKYVWKWKLEKSARFSIYGNRPKTTMANQEP